tara:strand:+ start:9 stop:530 length:522 start_codon:yes stop_codon:yes gene_type:complete
MKNNNIGEQVLTQEQIQVGVKVVAEQLNQKFSGEVVVITVVPGGILFAADLVRQLKFDLCMDTISCPHTPGDRINKSDILYQQNINIKDKHVIVIDDAIESGGTMKRLIAYLSEGFAVKSLSVATLFVKSKRVNIAVPQHFAYELESDDLLVGYGLPWNNLSRNNPFISKVIR